MKIRKNHLYMAAIGLLLHTFAQPLFAQYYFKDILSLQQTNRHFQLLKKENIKKVNLHSYAGNSNEKDGAESWQKISYNPDKMLTYTKTIVRGESHFMSYFKNGLLSNTSDSTNISVSETQYSYDAQQKPVLISTSSRSDGISSTEQHQWRYDANGKPLMMLRIRNQTDTTHIRFVTD